MHRVAGSHNKLRNKRNQKSKFHINFRSTEPAPLFRNYSKKNSFFTASLNRLQSYNKRSIIAGEDKRRIHVDYFVLFWNSSASSTETMSDVEMKVNLAWQEEEESSLPEGLKWTSLTHKGPLFPPEYEPLPDDVR